MKVLIIDDSSSERLFLQLYLQKAGHEVLCAADGTTPRLSGWSFRLFLSINPPSFSSRLARG